MAERLERLSPASAAIVTRAPRAYYLYRALHGDDVVWLLLAIGSPASWKLASLLETISSEQIDCVLSSFCALLPSLHRGAAGSQCVTRLGLRVLVRSWVLQAVTLRLQRCKLPRTELLPMQMGGGSAIAEYLQNERPVCFNRRVFVHHVAPVEVRLLPILAGRIIRDAYLRRSLPFTRPHIFRYTIAALILGERCTLEGDADVLRHRSLDTVHIYVKLNERCFSAVAMP